ncbi:MAG: glycosyltransferase family 4 protein [Candidatus Sericytochromatia bacterium]
MARINWSAIDEVIFVARHLIELACRDSDSLRRHPRLHHIPNGLDPGRFAYQERTAGPNLAFVGQLSHKKGLMLLMQAFKLLSGQNPELVLHLAGEARELRYLLYLEQFLRLNGLQERVKYHGWVEDIPAWLADKNYLISCSPFESQGMAVMEAMLTGIKPLIHPFVGAADIYPDAWLWNDLSQLADLFNGPYQSQQYHDFVKSRYLLADQLRKIDEIVE